MRRLASGLDLLGSLFLVGPAVAAVIEGVRHPEAAMILGFGCWGLAALARRIARRRERDGDA